MKSEKSKRRISLLSKIFLISALICSCWLLDGCAVVEFVTPSGHPARHELIRDYNSVELSRSTPSDVLTVINLPKYELLSQSQKVIASAGEKKKGYAQWFKMVAFNEKDITARRKYLFIVDERPKALFAEPWERVEFYSDALLEKEVLDKPYTDENASLIAILKHFLVTFQKDASEVSSDNEILLNCKALVNQALNTVLQRLEQSPAEATKLNTKSGLEFEHINFDKGRVRMLIHRNILTLDFKMGSFLKKRLEWRAPYFQYKSGEE